MSSSWLTFDPIFPPALVFIILALVAFFVYKELHRPQRFLVIRVTAICIIAIALLGIFLRPMYEIHNGIGTSILLTKNFDRNKIDSILKLNPNAKILRTEDADYYSNSSVLNPGMLLTRKMFFA